MNGPKAEGGPVTPGVEYLVGASGPEYFIVEHDGVIIPGLQIYHPPMARRPDRLFLGIPTWAWAVAIPAGIAIALIALALVSGALAIGEPVR